jgi:L-serine/L-threonine ammonia-lyase
VHAARTLGVPCTVVVPSTVKQLMVTKIKAAGAYEVLQHGDAWADADKYMREELMPQVCSLVPLHYCLSSKFTSAIRVQC